MTWPAVIGSQFGGRHGQGSPMYDDAFLLTAGSELESALSIQVTIRRATGTNPGNPAAGIMPKPIFLDVVTRAYLYEVSLDDAFKSGGYYQPGDIVLGFERQTIVDELRASISEEGQEGDRIVFRDREFRIVGALDFNPFGNVPVVFVALCRKMGNPLA